MKYFGLFILFNLFFATLGQASLPSAEENTIKIYNQVVPSVVNVTNIKLVGDWLFGMEKVPAGTGTGYVWDKDGHIVTNYHVVEGGREFLISFFQDPKKYKAQVVGFEPRQDIAVLKLDELPQPKLVPIQPGRSDDLQVGQTTLAIGNPFGLDHSLSKGIVSALGRKIEGIGGVKIHNMIQTDAAINQGNSGGPLLNSDGKLIGMNTMIFSTSGSNAGLGFAVPVNTIKQVVPDLIQFGKVKRPALGIAILEDQVKSYYYPHEKGVIIKYIYEGGAADKADLQGMKVDDWGRVYIGDIILTLNEQEVNSLDDLFHQLGKYKIGESVTLKVKRKDKIIDVKLTLSGQ